MQKYFDLIYKIIVIVAITWLIYSSLNIFNMSSKRLDEIEKKQAEIILKTDDIILQNQIMLNKADSVDKIKAEEIKKVLSDVNVIKNQTTALQKNINGLKETFNNNKIDLPNPWE